MEVGNAVGKCRHGREKHTRPALRVPFINHHERRLVHTSLRINTGITELHFTGLIFSTRSTRSTVCSGTQNLMAPPSGHETITARNLSSTLPQELLAEIFLYLHSCRLADSERDDLAYHPVPPWVAVSHVCTRWRNVAVNSKKVCASLLRVRSYANRLHVHYSFGVLLWTLIVNGRKHLSRDRALYPSRCGPRSIPKLLMNLSPRSLT